VRNIAIIGSGQAGLLAAHGLVNAGYRVTVYSDRTADNWLNDSRPTGTAARFDISLSYERELGLNHWEEDAPKGEGVHLTFSPTKDNRFLTLAGRLKSYFLAIDLRLQSHRWMNDLLAKGGKIEIENVTVARLDEIAAEHELTIVAAGRAELANLFERDAARSVYDKPQRNLTMIITTGGKMGFEGVPFLPVKFNFFAPFGEAFYVPYFHKDHGPTWNMLIEAKAGGPLDRFGDCKSGEQAVERYKQVIKEIIPWDYEWAKNMELADTNGWLIGRVTPTVRKPVGRLPSGRVVTPLGDTAMSLDPIGGQGANNGNKMARNLVEAIIARKDLPFDAQWMTETFERFYSRFGHMTYTFNNILLEPITNAGKMMLIAQYGSDGRVRGATGQQRIADVFIDNFNDANVLTPAFLDSHQARAVIRKHTGLSWPLALARGAIGVAKGQLRQKLDREPGHPLVHAEPSQSR
jgi:Styrene monooxygenase A putative substrate binding domain